MAKKILVETSARHVHLSDADLETLFGKGAVLHKKKDLSQPGQFASEERVDVVGPKKTLARVSVLGPTRKQTQVELAMTDARSIGIDAPIRESGDLEGSAGCKLVGPAGEIELSEGVIIAKRHIHTTPEDAAEMVRSSAASWIPPSVPSPSVMSSSVSARITPLLFTSIPMSPMRPTARARSTARSSSKSLFQRGSGACRASGPCFFVAGLTTSACRGIL